MRGFIFSATLLAFISTAVAAQEKSEQLDSAVVSVSRAGRNTPVTYTFIGREQLRKFPVTESLPMALSMQPSVVTTNEGGTGLGYSKMTVRGSKGSQINVTLNGITLNDAESQEVFWVNIPALSDILGNVQLQRGLGTSANGAGAFGASINMSTAYVHSSPYSRVALSGGSYNSGTLSVAAGTGLSKKGFYADLAFTYGTTDGYIRNAWADAYSIFGVVGWMRNNNSVKFTFLRGNQHTGITWEGISADKMKEDRTYNPAGKYKDGDGNVCYYDNESDNYAQNHYQLNYVHQFDPSLTWTTTLDYTKGDGYYEQYKTKKDAAGYGIPASGVYDFITRKEMDNGCAVLNSTLKYAGNDFNAAAGVYLSDYDGDHFGDILWTSAGDYAGKEWYRNNGRKKEATAFVRGEYTFLRYFTGYAEMQYRSIGLRMKGLDDDFSDLAYSRNWNFFNPRAGLTYRVGAHRAYASVALGHREPGRSDLKEQIEMVNVAKAVGDDEASVTLRPERMIDTEIGYEFSGKSFSAAINIYSMEYRDMLLENGRISDSGYAIKENVDRSWRRGVELSGGWKPLKWVRADANLTLSSNKIKDYVYLLDTYDNASDWKHVVQIKDGKAQLVQLEEKCGTTTMLMSPSVTGMFKLAFSPFRKKNLDFGLTGKYVGSQYWDNTANSDRRIPAYFVTSLFVEDSFDIGKLRIFGGLKVNNLLNKEYYADAWVYRAAFLDSSPQYVEEGLFPQALRNFSILLRVEF